MGDYIGNKPSFQVFPENTKDDLIPFGLNDLSGTGNTFLLSQEVPGGYEGNVQVVVNNVIQDIETAYTIGGIGVNLNREITFVDALASADTAYVIHRGNATHNFVPSPNSVSPESLSFNLRNFVVDKFDDTTSPFDTDGINDEFLLTQSPVTSSSLIVTLDTGGGPVIQDNDDANIGDNGDYRISGEILLRVEPSELPLGPYVIGEILDIKQGVTVIGTGRILSISSNEITVQSIDGVYLDADNIEGQTSSETNTLQVLDPVVEFPKDLIQFITPPAIAAKIRVLHLGFSTVSRRSNLTEVGVPPGGVGTLELEDGSVTTPKLAELAVTNSKIANDTIQGTKILLENNQYLRGRLFAGTIQNILAILTDDSLRFESVAGFTWRDVGTNILNLAALALKPLVDNVMDLGGIGERFKDAFIAGDIALNGSINMDASETVDGVDVSQLKSDFDDAVSNGGIAPVGTIVMFGGSAAPTGWLLCDGTNFPTATHPILDSVIGTTFGGNPGVDFDVPDFRQRFPIGVNAGVPALGGVGGSWNHVHSIPLHDHDVVQNITMPAHVHNAPGGNLRGTYNHKHRLDRHHHTTTHEHFLRGHGHAVFGNSGTRSIGIRPSIEVFTGEVMQPLNHGQFTTLQPGARDYHAHRIGAYHLSGTTFTSAFAGSDTIAGVALIRTGVAGTNVKPLLTDFAHSNTMPGFGGLTGSFTSGPHGHDPLMFFGRVGASGASQGAANVPGSGIITAPTGDDEQGSAEASDYLATGATTQASAEDGDFGRATAGLDSGSFNSTNAIVSAGGSTISGFAATDDPDITTVNITAGVTGPINSAPNIAVNQTSGDQNQGSQDTGTNNPPFLAVNFIIKHD